MYTHTHTQPGLGVKVRELTGDMQLTRQEIAETQELYNAKYTAFFRRETENQIMFRQLSLEKPTKWFLNLANDQKDAESPAQKLKKYCDKYKDTPEWGTKYEKKEDAHKDMYDHFKKHL